MNLFGVGKRLVTAFAFLAICIAVSSLETACDAKPGVNPGGAGEIGAGKDSSGKSPEVSPEKTEEQWTGQQGTNKVILTIKSGGENATLEYRGQRDCTLDAKDSGTDQADRKMYVLTSRNGGFCNKLTNGVLYLKKQGVNLSYTLTNDKNEEIETGKLK